VDYGDYLESAAAGLARAHAALREPPPAEAAVRASAAVARARLYHGLERQVVAVGGVHERDLPRRDVVPSAAQRRGSNRTMVANLATFLRHASAQTLAAGVNIATDLRPAGPVALALHDAYRALQLANEILISNTGPHTGPANAHRPMTSDGMAVLSGVGREDNLAALARLAAAAADTDVRLVRWMWPEDAPSNLRPLLTAAEEDAWQTKSGPLNAAARTMAGLGRGDRAPVRGLVAGPPVDDPQRWSALTSRHDCVAAVDAARSWLTQHSDEVTVKQLARAAGAALAIIRYVGHVHAHTGAGADLDDLAATAVRPWRGVLQSAGELRSPVLAHADHSTLTVALAGVAVWLQEQLRPGGQWRDPSSWAGDPGVRAGWRTSTGQIIARMPDLADQLHEALWGIHGRGGVLAPTGRLIRQPGQLVRATQWSPVPTWHPAYVALLRNLRKAATESRAFAAAAGVGERPGLRAAVAARGQAPTNPARLAGQWYPQGAETDGPGHQAPTSRSHPAQPGTTRRAPRR
jgi:hypothetical protein